MDREQLKLLSNQQKEQLLTQAKSFKELEAKLAGHVKDNDALKDDLKKQEAGLASAKKTAGD